MKELLDFRARFGFSQAHLAQMLGVTQAYISQIESGRRPVTRQLANRLAALPDLPEISPTVFPVSREPAASEENESADLAADLGALGYPPFTPLPGHRPNNPAAVILAIIGRRHVGPNVIAGVPWVLLSFPSLDTRWLLDQTRRRNLQNRLGFLTDLALLVARARGAKPTQPAQPTEPLEHLRAELEDSRLVKEDTLARVLPPAERQFFSVHRSDTARHWNLVTGLAVEHLPYR
ncbi:MAG: helix-turn-helix transcriptional regulator [Acidobacteriota bacterium]|nr:helix-turn-helix transcriptional regulator [Acidobacteriota bacterium]